MRLVRGTYFHASRALYIDALLIAAGVGWAWRKAMRFKR